MADHRIRLALLAASPIYYQVPLYQRIAADPRIDFTAIFASNGGVRPVEAGFSEPVQWDVNLLEGYRAHFLRRAATNPIEGRSFFTFRDLDIVKTLRDRKVELLWLFGYNFLTHQLAALTQLLKGRPVLFREEQTLFHSRAAWRQALKRLVLPPLFAHFFGLYIGAENYQWLKHYGIPTEHMYFVPYCVDNQALRESGRRLLPAKEQLRRQFGVDSTGPVILTVARLIPKKQPILLLEAFARLRAQRECSLVIVGSGPLENAIREKIQRDNIPNVVLAGFLNQSQIAKAYAAADIFVLPSGFNETWGIVVNEAMNFGLPIVVSDKVGCARDLVHHGENGYVVGTDAVKDLTESLMQLVDSEDLRRQFGEASLKIVEGFNYDVAAQGLLRAVAEAVGSRRWAEAASTASSPEHRIG